jgi:hypothetical protein
MVWAALAAAIVAEVTATPASRGGDGPTRPWPSVVAGVTVTNLPGRMTHG